MHRGTIAFWDDIQVEASLDRGRNCTERVKVRKQLSILPVPPGGWKSGYPEIRQRAWHLTSSCWELKFLQRSSAGPARALVLVLSNQPCENIPVMLLASREMATKFPRSPLEPHWIDLGKQVWAGLISEGFVLHFIFLFPPLSFCRPTLPQRSPCTLRRALKGSK